MLNRSFFIIFSQILITSFLILKKSEGGVTPVYPNITGAIKAIYDKCPGRTVDPGVCAIVFDSEDCRPGKWRDGGFIVPDNGWRALTLPWEFQYDTESLIVKAGCKLGAYSDPLCRRFPGTLFHTFEAHDWDLIEKELEDSKDWKIGKLFIHYHFHTFQTIYHFVQPN